MTNVNPISQSFVDCEDIAENAANFSFNTKVLKIGKAKLSLREIERISFLLAHDSITFADTGGNTSTLSANALYSHLQSNQ